MKIGNVTADGNIFLAPMAGVTDKVFRNLCREQGAALSYTEMVSGKGLMYNSKNTESLLERGESEVPYAVQLFGSEPEILSEAMKRLEQQGVEIFDINMGCPAPKIVKNGEGSALMDKPLLVGEIVKKCAEGVKAPVTVKIRKGFHSENAVEIARICEESGAAAIALHGRTRDEFYSGAADWKIIKQVKEAVKIPVIGNGDVTSGERAAAMLNETGCDAVMVGRGAMGNPFVFREINEYLKTGAKHPKPTFEERLNMALKHMELLAEYKGERTAVREMRSHLSWYIKGLKGAASARTEINRAETRSEMRDILKRLFSE
ncbi:MAG: tRNA dihydrouridine synthase DusB [Clostridiales bacterium]|nr:tRNA dihydrouridine synthase DusB [Clostridiales bacterium]